MCDQLILQLKVMSWYCRHAADTPDLGSYSATGTVHGVIGQLETAYGPTAIVYVTTPYNAAAVGSDGYVRMWQRGKMTVTRMPKKELMKMLLAGEYDDENCRFQIQKFAVEVKPALELLKTHKQEIENYEGDFEKGTCTATGDPA